MADSKVFLLKDSRKSFENGLSIDGSDNNIDTSYSFLLEELKLKEETEKPEIEINYNSANAGNHRSDLLLTKLANVEGVNALTENQTIDFNKIPEYFLPLFYLAQ